MTKKKMITEDAQTVSPYELDLPLSRLKERIEEFIAEYGPDARFDWDRDHWEPYDTSPSPRYTIKVVREETDQELAGRLATEAKVKEDQRKRDIEELERIQKRLGIK